MDLKIGMPIIVVFVLIKKLIKSLWTRVLLGDPAAPPPPHLQMPVFCVQADQLVTSVH